MSLNKKFNVPENYQIKQTRFKAKGTMAQNEYWEYDVFDENGKKVFTIEHWHCTSLSSLQSDTGYRKYDLQNKLVEEKS